MVPEPLAGGGLKLVVLIPCLDEEATVGRVVAAVPRSLPGIREVEVVVLDDGSTDATAERAREAGARVVRHGRNLGLGVTFRQGVGRALELGADIVVNIDGDGQFDPADIAVVVAPVVAGEAEMATASRFAAAELVPEMPAVKRWGNRRVASLVSRITGHRFHDVSCGFRAFSREALLRMNLFGSFTYTQETFIDLLVKGQRVVEIPVSVRGTREFGRSRVASNLFRYAFRSLQIMFRAAVSFHPFPVFGFLAAGFFAPGLALLGFLVSHYLRTGAFSPHIWAGFVGGSLCFVGVVTLILGVMADMMMRMRLNQEQILYFLKSERYGRR